MSSQSVAGGPGVVVTRRRLTGARDLVDMWGNTRMVVLTAISASLYAAILIPFKVLPIIPGVTEFRPANAVPVVCSFLFGPAGAWGAAIGNVIGDFFGGIGPGDLFGFLGNFLYGLIPYKVWEAITDSDPVPHTPGMWIAFVGTVLLASAVCALSIGWGINLLGFIPFSVLGNIILINNFLVAVVLTPFLLAVIYPRVKRGKLLYRDIMPRPPRFRWSRRLGLAIVVFATVAGMVLGNLLSSGRLVLPFLAHADLTSTTHAADVGLGLIPVMALLAVGVLLL
ncbi:MAG TPA: QueT transporter family protein [Candidatus Binatia bacterium]|jgi:energy-coupling factor transport system substrate-specific component